VSTEEFMLRRQRSFGEVLNGTLTFVNIHRRIIFRALMQLVMPALVVMAGLIVIVLQNYVVGVKSEGGETTSMIVVFVLVTFISILLIVASASVAATVYYAVIRLSLANPKEITLADIRAVVRKKVWKLIGLNLLQTLVMWVLSIALSAIPGIVITQSLETGAVLYLLGICGQLLLYTYLGSAAASLMIEDTGVIKSMQRSFEIVRGDFWRTFGLTMMIGLLTYLMMLAPIAHPVLLATALYKLFDPLGLMKVFEDNSLVMILLGAVYGLAVVLVAFFLFMIPSTALALNYLSLVERKEGIGLAQKVAALPKAIISEANQGVSESSSNDDDASLSNEENASNDSTIQ
jgi:hypothetical protein